MRIGAAAASRQVTLTEQARERMGRLAEATGRQCVASTVVGGGELVAADQLADGIHPDDAGHAALAAALGPAVGAALQRAGSQPAGSSTRSA